MPVDRIGYGYGLFSAGDFGVEGVTQDGISAISATSSSTAAAVVVSEGSATIASTSTVATGGERIRFTTQATSATSSTSSSAVRVKPSDGSLAAQSTITASARRVPEGSALVNGVSTTSAISTVNAWRYRNVSATTRQTSYSSASSVYSIIVKPTIQPVSSVTVTAERKRIISLQSTATSSGIAYGVKKWEQTDEAVDSWATISETTITWTPISNDSNTWTNVA